MEEINYNRDFTYYVQLPDNDVCTRYSMENGKKTYHYRCAFRPFKNSNTSFKDFSDKGFIYATTYLDTDKSKEEEYLLNHIRLRKFINAQEYDNGSMMLYLETCGIKDGNTVIGLYVPINWHHIYYKAKLRETIGAASIIDDVKEEHETENLDNLFEIAEKICKEFNLQSVLCKKPNEKEAYKVSTDGKESIGIISNADDLAEYLGGYDCFAFSYCSNHIHAMTLFGHVLTN